MNEMIVIIAAGLAVLHLIAAGIALLPLRRMKRSLLLASKRLEKMIADKKGLDVVSVKPESLFTDQCLSITWRRYLSGCLWKEKKVFYPAPEDYFQPKTYFEEHTNTRRNTMLPLALLVFSGLAAAAYAYWRLLHTLPGHIPYDEFILLIAGSAVANLVFSMVYQNAIFSARKAMRSFVALLEDAVGGSISLTARLSGISHDLAGFKEDQNDFYETQTAQLGGLVVGSLEPFLEKQQKLTENFVRATTVDQEQAMRNLAQYFVEQMTKAYARQMSELADVTANMTEIQAKTSLSLSNISEFFELSRDSMEHIHLDSRALSAAFDEQIRQLDVLNQSISANVKAMADLSEFIRTNSRNQQFTIENLADFQDRLLTTSDRTTEAMETFFTEFKDHYSSYLLAMKAASADMKESSGLIQNAYKEFAGHMDQRVSATFTEFEEQMSRLSLRMAESTRDLSEAIDELPGILRRIGQTDDSPSP